MIKNKIIITIIIMMVALGLLGCSQQNPNPVPLDSTLDPAPEASKTIMINHFVFEPNEVTINAGETVKWIHNDNVAHKIVSTDDLFDADAINRGAEFIYTFENPGEYNYYCSIHPSMTGKIIVK